MGAGLSVAADRAAEASRMEQLDTPTSWLGGAARSRGLVAVEVGWLMLLWFILGGGPVPEVNEAHYLTKARHFWDPSFCSRDLFLNSGDGHYGFFFLLGGITQWLSLPAAAWVGRTIGWLALAWSWQRLSAALVPVAGASLLSAGAWAVLVETAQMSGEWVIGGWEAKVLAYALVFAGLAEVVHQRWGRAGLWMGAATAFHVLVGGWSWLLVALAWLADGRPTWRQARDLAVPWIAGLALAAIGLVPALQLQSGVSPVVAQAAHQIYTWGRLSHHLLLRNFPHEAILLHVLLIAVFMTIWRMRPRSAAASRLGRVVWGAIGLALVGALLDATLGAHPRGASLLRFYWFRSTDVLVPLGVSLLGLAQLQQRYPTQPRRVVSVATVVGLLVLVAAASLVGQQWRQNMAQGNRQGAIWSDSQLNDWIEMCDWIRQHTPRDALLLTPPDHQTFKWYAERSELVTSKDVPQSAEALVEWWKRLTEVRQWQRSTEAIDANRRLNELLSAYEPDYVLVRQVPGSLVPRLAIAHQNPAYLLLVVPRETPGGQSPASPASEQNTGAANADSQGSGVAGQHTNVDEPKTQARGVDR
jgi:hypothetical protein